MSLQIRFLGPLEVIAHGQPVRLTGRLRVLLLALATSAGRVVSPERLVTAMWGQEELPANPRASVQTYITRLRRLIGAEQVGTDPAGYVLRTAAASIDGLRFMELLDAAASAKEEAAERELLGEALALWRGTPFDGVRSQWLEESETPGLVERYLTAVERRIDLELAAGRHSGLVAQLRELTTRYPLREPLWVRLLIALDRCGRKAEALEHYEAVRRQLASELGVDPGPELQAVFADLLSSRLPQLAGDSTNRVVPRHLPVDVAGFIGRAECLSKLDSMLDEAQPPAITVIGGAAGIGKTALAVHWAHRIADRFADGQLYVNLRGFDPSGAPRSPAEVLRGFLDALQVQPQQIPEGLEAQAALYRSLMAGRRMLVVLDNARDAPQVRQLLPGWPGCLVIVTSRDRLLSLIAAEGARPVTLEVLSTKEAWQLLERRLGSQRVAADPAATRATIARCASLPLALAVLAARAALRSEPSLRAISSELDGEYAGLDAFADSDPVIDVRAVFSWSYRTLSAGAARLFRLIGVHPGPDIATEAAASLAGTSQAEVHRLLSELCAVHLISEQTPGRYWLHDLLRAYAAEQSQALDTVTERRAATRRMLDHYVHSAHTAAMLLYPQREPISLRTAQDGVSPETFPGHRQAFAWCVAEHSVLLAAVRVAVSVDCDHHAWQLAWALVDSLDRQGRWHDLVDIQLMAIDAARRSGSLRARAQAHRDAARAYGSLRKHNDAKAHLRLALDLYAGLGDQIGQANTNRNLGWIYELQGRFRDAIGACQVALVLYEAAGDRVGQARARNGIGWNHSLLGEYDQALDHCGKALGLHRAVGNRVGQAATLDSIGFAYHHLGRYSEAVVCYEQSLGLFNDLGERYGATGVLVHLGDTHLATGDAVMAAQFWQRALHLLTDLGHGDADEVKAKLEKLKAI